MIPIKVKLYCLAIVALTLWLGGFGCALCCANQITESCCPDQPNAYQVTSLEAERGESSCCAKSQSCNDSTDAITQPEGVKACNLFHDRTPSFIASSQVIDDSIAEINELQCTSLIFLSTSQFAPPSLPHNRSGTYLRCCVLLI